MDGGIESVTHSLAGEFSRRGYKCLVVYYVEPTGPIDRSGTPFEAQAWFGEKPDFDIVGFARDNKAGIVINNCIRHKAYNADLLERLSGAGCGVYTVFHASPGYELVYLRNKYFCSDNRNLGWRIKKLINIHLRYDSYYRKRRNKLVANHTEQIKAVDKLVLLSDRYKDKFMTTYDIPEKYRNKLATVSNPLRFPYQAESEYVAGKEKEVLMVARLEELDKRVSLALTMWAAVERTGRFPDWKFSIVGHGPDEGRYARMIEEMGLKKVSLEGRRDSLPYYRRASIIVMTSPREGFPMVLPEAMQNGVVPVVFDTFEALHDIVADGRDGFIVPEGDMDGFAKRVMELMSDEGMRQEMARSAVAEIGRYTIENVADRWEELFRMDITEQ